MVVNYFFLNKMKIYNPLYYLVFDIFLQTLVHLFGKQPQWLLCRLMSDIIIQIWMYLSAYNMSKRKFYYFLISYARLPHFFTANFNFQQFELSIVFFFDIFFYLVYNCRAIKLGNRGDKIITLLNENPNNISRLECSEG